MDSKSTDSTSNMPSGTVSGTESTLDMSLMSLMGTLDNDAIQSLCGASTLTPGEPSLAALLAPWTQFDLKNCASGALNPEIPTTQNALGDQQVYPLYSPWPVLSPATSTETSSPFSLAHTFDDMNTSISPMGYPGFAFPSPATMGQDFSFPFLVGSPSPADIMAHAAQLAMAQTLPGIFSPYGATVPLVSQPTVPSLVQASSASAQGRPLRQESLFTCPSTSVGQPWASPPPFPGTLSALHPNAPPCPLPASASWTAPSQKEPHTLSKKSGATALPRSASLPDSLKTHAVPGYQGSSSNKGTTTVSAGLMHPSLAGPVPVVKATADRSSQHLHTPRMSIPASPQTNHHNANPASATSANASPSGTISPLITTNGLITPSASDVAEDVSTLSAPLGMRIRKTGLKRTHACDQCSQSYVRAEHLRRHVKSKHMGLKEHACSACDFRCSRSDNLRQHMRTMHEA